MNENCEVIRDLLPLYRDNVCSEASRALVEAHLKECAECRKVLEQIEKDVNAPAPSMEETFKAWQKLQRKILFKRLRIAVLTAALLAVAVVGGIFGYEQYMIYTYPMDVNEVEITALYRLEDGRIYLAMQGTEHNLYSGLFGPEVPDKDATKYSGTIRFEPCWSRVGDKGTEYHRTEFEYVVPANQKWYSKGEMYEFTTERIEIISGDQRRLVCEFDDELPAAPEEIEIRAKQIADPVNG